MNAEFLKGKWDIVGSGRTKEEVLQGYPPNKENSRGTMTPSPRTAWPIGYARVGRARGIQSLPIVRGLKKGTKILPFFSMPARSIASSVRTGTSARRHQNPIPPL